MESTRLLFLSKKFKKSLPKRAKDDNIIKLSFERDEKIKKVLVKAQKT